MIDVDALTWERPGAGQWQWDASHLPGAPTPMQQEFHFPNMGKGLANVFERFGIPLQTYGYRVVNGRVYARLLPLVGAESDRKPPPAPVLWLVVRLHPAFRKRNRTARQAMADRIWRAELAQWNDVDRAIWQQRDADLQAEPIESYDDDQLVDHLRRVLNTVSEGHELHFRLHGTDLGPIGDLLAHCEGWGIGAHEAVGALEGWSPASAAPVDSLAQLAKLVADAPEPPRTFADVRALGPAAADALDEYLSVFGWRMVTSYDVDGRCLIELPEVVLTSIRAGAQPRDVGAAAEAAERIASALRTRVPERERATFDELIAEARSVYGLRDDNGPLTIEWPVGLLRRAILEAGRRLVAAGRLHDVEHACELSADELASALRGNGLSADEVAERAADRRVLAALLPPPTLGPDEAEPPVHVFPAPMARAVRIAMTAVQQLDAPLEREPLVGLGIGDAAYTGRARVAREVDEVLGTMEPGDVLVTCSTNPAFNTVLLIAGAVVCEEGGPLSHAAVMARELGIPAVIGARGVLEHVRDGDTVEVDPASGRVRVL